MVLLKITALSMAAEAALASLLDAKGYRFADVKRVSEVPFVVQISFSRLLSKGVVSLNSPELVRISGRNIMRHLEVDESDYELEVMMHG